jgi:glycosyltransferase involved in cell wall biosynthesis
MGQPTFSIVVPIIPRHHRYAKRLIKNIMHGSVKPLEIILAGSSQTDKSIEKLKVVQQLYPDLVKIYPTSESCTAGQNRNRGWEIAKGDYICFCDADDLYSPFRLEFLKREINRSGADLIIHDYLYQLPLLFLRFTHKEYRIIESKELYDSTFPEGKRRREQEFGSAGESNILIPLSDRDNYRIHHGHATVKRSIKIRYSDYPYAEDGIFCRDMLFTSHQISYLSAKLSIYEALAFERVLKNFYFRVISELAKIKKGWVN